MVFDDMKQCTEEDVRRMLPLVGPKRQEQALRYKHVFGQWACLKVCELLRELLLQEPSLHDGGQNGTGWQGGALPDFEYNEYGKPSLPGMPDFSFSHCRKAVAVAVSEDCEGRVGIDIEEIRGSNTTLAERVMNEEEQRLIAASERPEEMFTRLWTRKEAVLKWRGTGIICDLKDVLAPSAGEQPARLTTKVADGYAVTVAADQGPS